ncbi:MAG: calcium-translocating P-type ATPase, PMCA-type [Clostridia bacterium]|nr:calcium-translocating P-type ATPase, PMCA-type [Clostridia bacterium]
MKDYQTKDQRKKMGLCDEEVRASRAAHGANILTKARGKGFLRRFFANLNDPVIRILLAALIINLILLSKGGNLIETLGIGVAVFLATLISTLSEYGSARAFEALSEENDKGVCRVRRSGVIREIPISEVVVGDVILLDAGEQIPADGLLRTGELKTDQSCMTGENREVKKQATSDSSLEPNAPSALFRGCTVTAGGGEMEVAAVGDRTFLGQISREIQQDTRKSPLKIRLEKLARQISRLGYLAAALVAFAYLFNVFVLDSGMQWAVVALKIRNIPYLLEHLFHAFTLALTVLVVAVPEGLPMMIAVVLSSNIRKMLRDRVLVRKAVGVEAAGSMNILFTDKTGTLTEGKMKLTACLAADGTLHPFERFLSNNPRRACLFSLIFRFNNAATEGVGQDGTPCVLGGSATERALLESILHLPIEKEYRVTSRLPFDSARKYSAVSLSGKEPLTLVMGAPEKLLGHIVDAVGENASPLPFSKSKTEKELRRIAATGARVLTVAVLKGSLSARELDRDKLAPMSFLGAVCLTDPVRREAASSVATLQDAGVQVVMMTGDNPQTAETIAKQCGILNRHQNLILTGTELSRMTDAEIRERLPHIAVIARALPTDKSRLVRLSQELGMVTGMTGDGINDAPALRRADIGFSMGSGTQVAKDAGDILIMDNNLASIVRAVLYGRTIFKSIRKFITLQLTMNFCAVAVTMLCPFLGIDSPVTVVQMLWINIIMDTLGGLAFAGEPPRNDYMKESPKRRDEPILNRYMVNQIVLLGGFTVALCLYFLFSPTIRAVFRPHEQHLYLLTAFFALFIFSSVFNCFNARTDRLNLLSGLAKNRIFLLIMLAILVIQIGFVYLGGSVLRTAPLLVKELVVTLLLSLSVFPFEIIRKALWRLRGKKNGF